VARIELPHDNGDDELLGLWSMNPSLSGAAAGLSAAVYDSDVIPLRTRELMRMRIAEINHCTTCRETRVADPDAVVPTEDDYANVSAWRTWPGFSEAERVAVSFAELFAIDHLALDDGWFEGARQHFTDAQLHAMGIMVGSWVALGRMQTVFDVHSSCALRI
jgi:alkylhydroperoxidase family enzyme